TVYQNYKFYYFLLLLLLSVVAAIKNKKLGYLAILLPAFCIYFFVDDTRAGKLIPSVLFFILFICSLVYFLYVYTSKYFANRSQQKMIILPCLFVLCFLCFSTMNFYTYRYVMAAIFPLLFLVAVFADMLMTNSYRALYYPVIAVLFVVSFFSFKNDDGYGDTNLGAYKGMEIQQDVVNYMEQTKAYEAHVGAGSFLERQHLVDSSTGFLHSGNGFKNTVWDIDELTDFAIFDNLESDYRYGTEFNKDSSFVLVHRCQKNGIWAEIYKRKTPVHN
ncbi:MAG: hypothetical protein JWQ38_3821, partial [Flavipsychrobacter sp.]|nr:hypothetical protein [Flavipsychrobacter sp.]